MPTLTIGDPWALPSVEMGVGQTIPTLNSEHGSSESVLDQIEATMSHPGEHKVFSSLWSPSGLRKSI